jgi:post-segregation antitoxin (ccd killing protein)
MGAQAMSARETVTLELDSEVVAAAQPARLDLAAVLLEALHRRIPTLHAAGRAARAEAWLEENRSAIEAYNRMIEQDGFVFSDGARTF